MIGENCKHPVKRYKSLEDRTVTGYTCLLCGKVVVFTAKEKEERERGVKQEDMDRLFPEQARMREEAKAEREKLGITLEQVAWVVDKLHQHMHGMGTYRYLIYTRMGFPHESDAYMRLMETGLMDLHNHLVDFKPHGYELQQDLKDKREPS